MSSFSPLTEAPLISVMSSLCYSVSYWFSVLPEWRDGRPERGQEEMRWWRETKEKGWRCRWDFGREGHTIRLLYLPPNTNTLAPPHPHLCVFSILRKVGWLSRHDALSRRPRSAIAFSAAVTNHTINNPLALSERPSDLYLLAGLLWPSSSSSFVPAHIYQTITLLLSALIYSVICKAWSFSLTLSTLFWKVLRWRFIR